MPIYNNTVTNTFVLSTDIRQEIKLNYLRYSNIQILNNSNKNGCHSGAHSSFPISLFFLDPLSFHFSLFTLPLN